MDDPLWKKILQIHTASFAISEMNSQVPLVSLKAELTVFIMAIAEIHLQWISIVDPLKSFIAGCNCSFDLNCIAALTYLTSVLFKIFLTKVNSAWLSISNKCPCIDSHPARASSNLSLTMTVTPLYSNNLDWCDKVVYKLWIAWGTWPNIG